MNRRLIYVIFVLLGIGSAVFAESDSLVGGQVSGHWTSLVHDFYFARSCTVASGSQLVIDPGVVVHVNTGGRFVVFGRLVAGGAGARLTISADGLSWQGMYFNGSFDDNYLTNCDLNVPINNTFPTDTSVALLAINMPLLYVDNCTISATLNDNIHLYSSTLSITNSQVDYGHQYNLYMRNSTLNATNCEFNNAALRNIYAINGSNLYLTRCIIMAAQNVSNGDGINIENSVSSGALAMNECEVSNNVRKGLWCTDVSSVDLNYVTFADNGAPGLYLQNVASVHAYRVTASGNGNISPGGEGVFCFSTSGSFSTCCFDNNQNYGVHSQNSTISLSFCNFYGNGSTATSGVGTGSDFLTVNPLWGPSSTHQRYPTRASLLINAGDPFGAPDSDRTVPDVGHHYYNLNHPPRFLSWTPTDTLLSGAWGDTRTFNVTYTDSDATDTVRVSWYQDGVLAGTGATFQPIYRQPSEIVQVVLDDHKPGGSVSMHWHAVVGVNDPVSQPSDYGIKLLYPVPTNGMITIAGAGAIRGRWQLIDLLGRSLLEWNSEQPAGSWRYSMHLPTFLPSGRYWILPPQQKPISLILLK